MSRFFRIMEKFSFGLNLMNGEEIVRTGNCRFVYLKDIRSLAEGRFDAVDDKDHNFGRFKMELFKRLKRIAEKETSLIMAAEAKTVVNEMGFPYFADVRYWNTFAAAVWLDVAATMERGCLAMKKYRYILKAYENYGNEEERMANWIGLMSQYVDYSIEDANPAKSYTRRILRKISHAKDWEKAWPGGNLNALELAEMYFAGELWQKGFEILFDKFSKAAEFLVKNGEAIK